MEASNIKAMREALEFAEDELWAHGLFDASKRIASALAAPPRTIPGHLDPIFSPQTRKNHKLPLYNFNNPTIFHSAAHL